MAVNVTEREAREVVEAARETEWKLPSFGKELFLGNFRLDLIHPQPPLDPIAVEKGERFLESLRVFLEEHVDPLQIERDAKIPDSVIDGLKQLGALGMKVPEQYGGLGPVAGVLQPRARAGRELARRDLDDALGAPVDRRRRAADAVRLRGAEAQVAAAGRQGPHLRVPVDRARRRARTRRGSARSRRRPPTEPLGFESATTHALRTPASAVFSG